MLHSEHRRITAHLRRKSGTKWVLEKLSSEEQLLRLTNSLDIFLLRGITNEQANYCMFESLQKVNMQSGNNEKINY